MRSALTRVVITLFIICTALVPKKALAHDPFSARFAGDHDILTALSDKPARVGDKFPAIHFKAKNIFGLGSVHLVFKARKLPAAQAGFVNGANSTKDHVVPTLLKGFVSLNRNSGANERVPAALSVIAKSARIQFLTGNTTNYENYAKARRLYTLQWTLTNQQSVQVKVSTKQNGSLLGRLCDTYAKTKSVASLALSAHPSKLITQARVVTLSTDADQEWYAAYGAASNAEIAAIVNAVEAIFERQIGVRFALVKQNVYVGASPYLSSDPSKLLAAFANNPDNPTNLGLASATFYQDVDVRYLFTGKDLDRNVVGLAYIGAVCWSANNAYGLIQNTTKELNITILAHELGHTFGATHDGSDPEGIMYPNLGIQRRFSSTSVGQINSTLSKNGQCLSEELVGANLANAKLTLKRQFSRDHSSVVFKGQLISNLALALPGELVKLTLNGRVVLLTTRVDGTFAYRMRLVKIKNRKITVFAQTQNGETTIAKPLTVQVRA